MSFGLSKMNFSVLIFTILSLLLLSRVAVFAGNNPIYIKNIQYENQGVVIQFSAKPSFQMVQVDEKQVLVAIKGGLVSKSINSFVGNTDFVKKISFDQMAGDVVALVFYTKKEVENLSSTWLPEGNRLLVQLASI